MATASTDDMTKQKQWNDNIASILSTFCKTYDIRITGGTIYSLFCFENKMADFAEIKNFSERFNFDVEQGVLVKDKLNSYKLPLFVLMKGYRTVLVLEIDDQNVTYIDGVVGLQKESIDDFWEYSQAHYFYVNPTNYTQEEDYDAKLLKENKYMEESEKKWHTPQVIDMTIESMMTDFKERI